MLGSVDRSHVFTLIEALTQSDGLTVVNTCDEMRQLGLSASSLLEEMCMVLQRMAVQQSVPGASDASGDPDPDALRIAELASRMPADETQLLYSMCLHGALTMVLLRLFAFKSASETAEKKTLKSPEKPSPPVVSPAAAPSPLTAMPLIDSALGQVWFEIVEQLVNAQKIQAMTRELAMQSQLVKRDDHRWVLQVERESLVSAGNIERLQQALHEAGHNVSVVTQSGSVTDSPAVRWAQRQQQRLSEVEEEILNDPVVQQLISEFDAKIVPGSIKTLTH
jgi:DNA polymerase-3 subunit gamma/tau